MLRKGSGEEREKGKEKMGGKEQKDERKTKDKERGHVFCLVFRPNQRL